MDHDAEREADKPGAEREHDPSRASTAEFRVPPKVDLTRPDIRVRRPARPAAEETAPEADDEVDGEPGTAEPAEPEDDGAERPASARRPGEERSRPASPAGAEQSGDTRGTGEERPRSGAPGAERGDVAARGRHMSLRREHLAGWDGAGEHRPAPGAGGSGEYGVVVRPERKEPVGEAAASRPAASADRTGEEPAAAGGSRPDPPPSAGPTRVETLPSSTSSGQWSVPWQAQETPERRRRRWPFLVAALLLLVAGVAGGQLLRPVPEPAIPLAIPASHAFPGPAPALPWPGAGQSAVYVEGLGMMGTAGGAAPAPTASVAKVMTAYVYLRDHPLRPGDPGPVLTVSPETAAQVPMRKKRGESLLEVTANQPLTQRKALEALMVISANDVAHELARWDSGSVPAFVAKMNEAARSLGMTGTRYTDPSGYDSGTVSTAEDQVKLLRAAMRLPSFAEIVNTRTYDPQDGGPVREGGNFLLGRHGIVGGKTGYTDAAGGNFVFAARTDVQGVPTLIVGAVMGQRTPTAAGAVHTAGRLVAAASGALTAATLAPAGARVARIDDGLGGTTPLRAAAPVTVVGWPGLTVPVRLDGEPPRRAGAGDRVAAVTAGAARVPLEAGRALNGPSYLARLVRLR